MSNGGGNGQGQGFQPGAMVRANQYYSNEYAAAQQAQDQRVADQGQQYQAAQQARNQEVQQGWQQGQYHPGAGGYQQGYQQPAQQGGQAGGNPTGRSGLVPHVTHREHYESNNTLAGFPAGQGLVNPQQPANQSYGNDGGVSGLIKKPFSAMYGQPHGQSNNTLKRSSRR